jgi:adenosylcobinamide kinase / adenosylcobinamide-phosphate guanylyltransferase
MKNLTFITGAVRSGKSMFAEQLAAASAGSVFYLATMQILEEDPEQLRRLEVHRRRRPPHWQTIDSPFAAHEVVSKLPAGKSFVIFDCLSLYITNMLIADTGGGENADPYSKEEEVLRCVESLLDSMRARSQIEFVIVSNEVGWGVVPETILGRAFRDFLGLSNQMVAAQAQRVFLCCSGLQLKLK